MNRKTAYFLLYILCIIAMSLRVFGINWDNGSHLHPDERAIVLSVLGLHFPSSLSEFFSPESPWNTHFFAYGNFPFYLLRIVADTSSVLFDKKLSGYDGIELVGRFLSALFDVGTVITVFFLGKKVRSLVTGLIAAFFYTFSVLPIQLSHFFAVDTPLTFFLTFQLFLLLSFYDKPSIKKSVMIGIVLALSLATKISSVVILCSIGITLTTDFVLIFLKEPHRIDHWGPHLPLFLKRLVKDGGIIVVVSFIFYFLLSPYTFLDFAKFQSQTSEQSRMTKNAFTFPYTLQYVGKIPYLYELKNIFFYGLGPLLATVCFLGFLLFLYETTTRKKRALVLTKQLILLTFFIVYFGIVGGFAVGFMRYMLPLYPLFCLFGALFVEKLFHQVSQKNYILSVLCSLLFAVCIFIWPFSFMHIYTAKHTRITATEWINSHIPQGKTIALEHWDDGLPLSGIEKYTVLTLPLYEPDTPEKWDLINGYLKQTDYIIIASNRLYVPLQKLVHCDKLPQGRCYIRTRFYYQSLFNGSLGFQKVAEFASFPTIPLLNWKINDQGADESFTVYDHPKIMIFQKETTHI